MVFGAYQNCTFCILEHIWMHHKTPNAIRYSYIISNQILGLSINNLQLVIEKTECWLRVIYIIWQIKLASN